jgi:hypothetical protein
MTFTVSHSEALAAVHARRVKLSELTDEQRTARILKARKSVYAHIARGGTHLSQRGMDLVDRYDDLREQLVGDRGYSAAWIAYCDSIGACRTHRGFDLFC